MENLPSTQSSNAPQTYAPPAQEQILRSDIVIPKLRQCQALSEVVTEGKANPGDIVRSTTVEKLGGKGKAVEFIPLTFQNLWMLKEDLVGKNNAQDFEFCGYEPRTASNEHAEWEYFEDGVKKTRTKVMNVFALLVSDLEAQAKAMKAYHETGEIPDLETSLLPVCIQFRGSSFKAAKDVATLFVKAADLSRKMNIEVPVYGRTMSLDNAAEKNDKGTFFVFKVTGGKPTPKEYLSECNVWRSTLMNLGLEAKVDESDNATPEAPINDGTVPF